MKLILTQFVFFIFITACATKPTADNNSQPFLRYERTACSGSCPVFTTEFFENGRVVTKVEENFLNGPGSYETSISEALITDLKNSFTSANFMKLENVYQSNMKDLPTTFITYKEDENRKTIKIYGDAPEQLETLKDELYDMIKDLNWKRNNSAD